MIKYFVRVSSLKNFRPWEWGSKSLSTDTKFLERQVEIRLLTV